MGHHSLYQMAVDEDDKTFPLCIWVSCLAVARLRLQLKCQVRYTSCHRWKPRHVDMCACRQMACGTHLLLCQQDVPVVVCIGLAFNAVTKYWQQHTRPNCSSRVITGDINNLSLQMDQGCSVRCMKPLYLLHMLVQELHD